MPKPTRGLRGCEALREREEHVRNVCRIAIDLLSLDACLNACQQDPHHGCARARLDVGVDRSGLELRERPREHHFAEDGARADERTEGLDVTNKIDPRIAGFTFDVQTRLEDTEPLVKHLPHEARLITEQLVDGRRRRAGILRYLARREADNPFASERANRGL